MLSDDRLLDLLAARATEGLPAGQSGELEQALVERPDLGADDLDLAAAAVYLVYDATRAESETMPEALRRRILRPDMPCKQARLKPGRRTGRRVRSG
jgi:hypothetical protein